MLRVIGVGNELRGDDAAGPRVIAHLRARAVPGLAAVQCPAEPAALMEAWREADHVVVVDAMQSGRPPGAVTRFDATHTPLPVSGFRSSTHGLGIADAVELGRALGRLPALLEVIGIEGAGWEQGAPLDPAVARAVKQVVEALVRDAAGGGAG